MSEGENVNIGISNPQSTQINLETATPHLYENLNISETAHRFGKNFRRIISTYDRMPQNTQNRDLSFNKVLTELYKWTSNSSNEAPSVAQNQFNNIIQSSGLSELELMDLKNTLSIIKKEVGVTFSSLFQQHAINKWRNETTDRILEHSYDHPTTFRNEDSLISLLQNSRQSPDLSDKNLAMLLSKINYTQEAKNRVNDQELVIEKMKTQRATFNQQMSYSYYRAGLSPDSDHAKKIGLFNAAMNSISNIRINSAEYSNVLGQIARDIAGYRSQAGIVRLLSDIGYTIFLPHWENRQEMEQFDRQGVDFVAIHQEGKILMIDAKTAKIPITNSSILPTAFFQTYNMRDRNPSGFETMRRIMLTTVANLSSQEDGKATIKHAHQRKELTSGVLYVPSSYAEGSPYGIISNPSYQRDVQNVLKKR